MEFLESNCSKKTIPKVADIQTMFRNHSAAAAIEEVYDYWLDKRLSANGCKLTHHVQIGDLQSSKNPKRLKCNPYAAFQPRPEMMKLRKNRARDCENYRQMVQLKSELECYRGAVQTASTKAKAKHELLKAKQEQFALRYLKRDFNSDFLDQNNERNLKYFMRKIDYERKAKPEHEELSPRKTNSSGAQSRDLFPFINKPGNQYHNVSYHHIFTPLLCHIIIINFFQITKIAPNGVEDETKTFQHSTSTAGMIRRRLGRGGRIIIDRFIDDDDKSFKVKNLSPEYRRVNISCNAVLHRYQEGGKVTNESMVGSSSSFFRMTERKGFDLAFGEYELVFE
jgi:hypothetical protein